MQGTKDIAIARMIENEGPSEHTVDVFAEMFRLFNKDKLHLFQDVKERSAFEDNPDDQIEDKVRDICLD